MWPQGSFIIQEKICTEVILLNCSYDMYKDQRQKFKKCIQYIIFSKKKNQENKTINDYLRLT